MSKLGDRFLVLIYVAIATLPLVGMARHWHDRVIFGALPETKQPPLRWSSVLDESYQHDTTAAFESHLGLRGVSIALDNTLLYRAFEETKPGATMQIGRDGVLFIGDDLRYFNARDSFPKATQLDRIMTKLAAVQREMLDDGRVLIPVIIPSKTSIWRDMLPDEWRFAGDPPSDRGVYRAYKDALERHHLPYVDARELLATSPLPREQLWGRDARHWSEYAACLALREIAHRYTEASRHADLQGFDCILDRAPGNALGDDDYDLWRLLNAYGIAPRDPLVSHAAFPPRDGAPAHLTNIMFIGSSFGFAMMRVARQSGLVGSTAMDYYNRTLMPGGAPGPNSFAVEPGSPGWQRMMSTADLYILDLFETGAGGGDVEHVLDQLLANRRTWNPGEAAPTSTARTEPGRWISFASPEGNAFVENGWSWREPWGIWAVERTSTLVLPAWDATRVRVTLRLLVAADDGGKPRPIRLHLGGEVFDLTFRAPNVEWRGTFETTTSNPFLEVAFEDRGHDQHWPANQRPLRVGLIAARVERASDPVEEDIPAAAQGLGFTEEWIPVTAGSRGVAYLMQGWSWAESWGTWTDQEEAVLALPVPRHARIEVSAHWIATAPPGQTQSMQVHLDDQVFPVRFATTGTDQVDSFVVTTGDTGWLVMRLDVAELAHAGDRWLGVGLTRVRTRRIPF